MKLLRIPSSSKLLNRILADPGLPDRIKNLEPPALARLIDRVGLEDCGEIVALTTPAQLQQIFDLDLWRSERPGDDEAFDSHRFGLWLEILLELGAAKAVERIVEMDVDFVTMAISQLIWAVSFEDLRILVAGERRLEKVIESSNTHELGEFYVFARQAESWDAVLTVLVELDREHHSFLIRLLEAISYVTREAIDDEGGLDSVLNSEEQLKSDVAFEREKRREAQGFVSPAEARAFLTLAEGPIDVEDHVSPKRFREWRTAHSRNQPAAQQICSSDVRYAAVQSLIGQDLFLKDLRLEELNYLANVLMSGGRATRPGEAAELVLRTCENGLKKKICGSLLEAFRAGWKK